MIQAANSEAPSSAINLSPDPRRRRTSVPLVLAGIVVVTGAVAGAVAWNGLPGVQATTEGVIFYDVKKQSLDIVVVERGALESAKNEDLVCQVEARSAGSPATTIKWIVPEGHFAKEGELVVELDSAPLQDQINTQSIKVSEAKATLTSAEADFEIVRSQNSSDIETQKTAVALAEIDLKKYEEGDYVKERKTIDGKLLIAEEELKRAKERLEYSERLAKKGYVSTSEVESDQLAVTRATNDLAMAKEELRVLDQYTKPRTVRDLQSKLAEAKRALERVESQARAKEAQSQEVLSAKKKTHAAEENTLKKLERQVERCKLHAPFAGMVTYANDPDRMFRGGQSSPQIEEGASVREGQKIVRIPDLNQMQVNVKVHEAKVARVRVGQPARIRVESLPDRFLNGTVKTIATMADQQSWMSTGVQVYTVMVSVDEQVEGLKPGMTSEVQILADKLSDVLAVPVQAVVERGGRSFVFAHRNNQFVPLPITLGVSNDKFIVVDSGINAGDKLVQNVASTIPEATLQELGGATADASKKTDDWAGRKVGPSGNSTGGGPPTKPGIGKAAGGPADSKGKMAGGSSRLLTQYDKNGDGQLTKDELPENASWLTRYDKNGDGTIDAAEIADIRSKTGGGGAGGGFRMPANGAEYIKASDKNGDGKVAKDELPEMAQQFFGQTDTNGDGFVDEKEAETAVQRMKERFQQMQQGGGFAPPGGE
jgi:RND family efflux transporter MFP subunit